MNVLHDKPPVASAPERSGNHLQDFQDTQVVPDEDHIHSLLQKTGMWRASSLDCDYRQGIATGFHQLDEKLAGHGWPSDAITEFLLPRSGIGELRLVMPALAHLSRSESRWQVWVSPPHIPYAPALVQAGIRLDRQLIIQPQSEEDRLWVLSKALASGACSLVMAWPDRIRPEQIAAFRWRAVMGSAQACYSDLISTCRPTPPPNFVSDWARMSTRTSVRI